MIGLRPRLQGSLLMLLLAFGLSRIGQSQETGKLYEYSLRKIASLLVSDARVGLAVAFDRRGAQGSATQEGDADVEGLRAVLAASFAADPRFSLDFLGTAADLLAQSGGASNSERVLLTRSAERGATLLLLVDVERYPSGGGEIAESVARLLEVPAGRELARDVVWKVVSSTGATSVFVNGVRIK